MVVVMIIIIMTKIDSPEVRGCTKMLLNWLTLSIIFQLIGQSYVKWSMPSPLGHAYDYALTNFIATNIRGWVLLNVCLVNGVTTFLGCLGW